MSMRRKMLAAAVLGLGLSSAALHAEEGGEVEIRRIALPNGFPEPTEADQKLLDLGDAALMRAYDAMRKNDEQTAIQELNKAMAFRNQVIQSKMTSKESAGKGFFSDQQGTPSDKVDMEGGLERFLEIKKTGGQQSAADHDYELHKRKILKDTEKSAKELAEQQKQLAEVLQHLAANPPKKSGTGDGEKKKDQAQNQPATVQGAGGDQQQNQNQNQQQTANGQQHANQKTNGQQQTNQNPQDANGQEQPNGQQQANQTPNGEQKPNDAQNPAGQAATNQDNITAMLDELATKLDQTSRRPGDQQANAAEAFRQAAESGHRTSDMIRKGDMQAAAANGRNTEQRIREALAAAGMANTTSLETALEKVEHDIKRLQNEQQKVLDQTQRAGANGKEADDRVRNERTKALAGEQANLMGQIKELQAQVNALAQGTGTNDPTQRTPENAARQELQGASRAMQGKRAAQAATNAAVQLGQGDIQSASKSMAQVQEALNAARQKVAEAGNALIGEDRSAAERTLRELKNLTSSLRRLDQTASTAAKGGEGKPRPNEKQPEGDGQHQTAGKAGDSKTTEGKSEQDPKGTSDQVGNPDQNKDGVSATWGQVLNRSAKDAQTEAMKMAGRLEKFTDKTNAKAIENASKKETEFERDFSGSLKQVRALLAELEKAELDLQSKVSQEQERRAMKNIQKDNIPSEYRGAVAAYYEELSKEDSKPVEEKNETKK